MFEWLFGWFAPTSSAGAPPSDSAAWEGTARDQWMMPGVYFGTDGWRLSDATQTRMSWVGLFGGTMTLTKDDPPAWTADEIELDVVRRRQRAHAAARGGGLVSTEIVELRSGAVALEILTKSRRGMGYGFAGRLLIDEAPSGYSIEIAVDEENTGVRESIVNGLRMQMGEIDIAAVIAGPADPTTGGRPIPGMQLDPYDATDDDQATYSASDDPRLDNLLQTHPLAVIRSTLWRAQCTWECASRPAGSAAPRPALPPSSGPRVVLSDAFFRELHAIVKAK